MRYIRTKDDIGIIIEEDKTYFVYENAFDAKHGCHTFYPKNDRNHYKTADSIIELCDVLVLNKQLVPFEIVEHKDFYGKPYKDIKLNIRYDPNILDYQVYNLKYEYKKILKLGTLYGAIWKPKGLVYVAKLNSKGAFELI